MSQKLGERKGTGMAMKRTALITGATGGIGEELCRVFARCGYDLVITARSEQCLNELAVRLRQAYDAKVMVVAQDLAQPGAAQHIYNRLGCAGISVDVLVNNAGYGMGGDFADNDPARQETMLQLNVGAATRMCRRFLPDMLDRGSGRILNMASIGAFVPGPANSIYCAAKAYLLHLSEALSQEVRGTGVSVTAVCPGATRTNFARRADMESTYLFKVGVMNPKQVAHAAYRAMMREKPVTVVGALNKAAIFATRLVPRCVSAKASGFIQKPRGGSGIVYKLK